jgi:hypothetical protein
MSNANVNILALNAQSYVVLLHTVVTMATIMMVTTTNTHVNCNANQSVTVTKLKHY